MVLAEQHSHVHFFGRCSKEQLVQKLASSHYTILPSRFLETF
ncbi:glycosyltransferase family 4 protein [bacterium]|nr:glycosyltransferase family 4 protein [bacterium]